MDISVDPDFHVQLLDQNRLGFYQYANILDGAFLLVATHVSEAGVAETNMVLVTHKAEYLRVSGKWTANNGAAVMDGEGGFQGSPVAFLLQRQAVSWWDTEGFEERSAGCLQFCSPFPYLYFVLNEVGVPAALFMDTDAGTWMLGDDGTWAVSPPINSKAVERQKIIESFIRGNPEELTDSLSKPWAGHSSRVRRAIDCGLLVSIPPSLAAEAITWWQRSRVPQELDPLQQGRYRSLLEGLSRPRLLVDDSGHICELVVSIDETLWVRERNQWTPFDRRHVKILSGYGRELPVDVTRLSEVCVWWDHRAVLRPEEKLAPGNLEFHPERSQKPEYGDVEIQGCVDSFDEFFDGVRYWLQQDEYWVVSSESMWADEIERLLPDPDTPF